MKAEWYYLEGHETVGPTTLEDLVRRIRNAGQSRPVWTEGMTEWADAKTVPALSLHFQTATSRSSATTWHQADLNEPLGPKPAMFLRRLRHELNEYLIVSAYLYICFSSLIFYKATILHSDGIEFPSFGIAIVKALILGKFILVLHALRVGTRRGGASVLFADILKNSVMFVIFLIANGSRGNRCRPFSRTD